MIWVPMPNTYYPNPNLTTTITNEIAFLKLGGLRLRYIWSNGAQTLPTNTYTYKIVIVNGTAKMAHPNTNWNNPKEVEEILNEEKIK